MSGLISNFPPDGIVTVNRVVLKPEYSVDDLQERVAFLCENVKTYHSDTGFVGGFVALNSGQVSNEGSTIGQAVESPMKGREALIVTFWTTSSSTSARTNRRPFSPCSGERSSCAKTATKRSPTRCCGPARPTIRPSSKRRGTPRRPTQSKPEPGHTTALHTHES